MAQDGMAAIAGQEVAAIPVRHEMAAIAGQEVAAIPVKLESKCTQQGIAL